MRFLLLFSLTALLPAPVASAQEPQEEVVIQGRGWGHGVGLAQDGAYAMGVAGADVFEILGTFYPGTSLGRQGGTVRVSLEAAPSSIVVSFPSGGEVHGSGDAPGFPVTVSPGGSVGVSYGEGGYRAAPHDGASAAPTPEPEPAPPSEAPAPSPPTTVPSLLGLIPLPSPTTVPPTPPVTAAPPAPEEPSEPTSEGPLLAVPREG
ncbi:MAG: hypothetical protein LC733_09475, partial [Actinobacteria bacterium]|nr:hypothetical protein [Actinomycetota bacterium]